MSLDNSHMAMGGVSSVTVPVQGTPMTSFQWTGYSGTFNQPANMRGMWDGEWNLCLGVVPIPFLGMEGVVQLDHAVIPIIEARMNDAMNVIRDALATYLYTNYSDLSGIIGLQGAIDDSTLLTTYGNLSRSTYTWWKSVVINAGTGSLSGTTYTGTTATPARDTIQQYINQIVKSTGEMPTFGLMGFGTWSSLLNSLTSIEQIHYTPDNNPVHIGVRFRSIDIAGVPIYPDPYCPEGWLFLPNMNYQGLHIHRNGSFTFSGFQSTIPNFQLGFVGVLVFLAAYVNTKPAASGKVYGLSYVSM